MKISTLFIISIAIIVPSMLFTFFMQNRRAIQENKIILEFNQSDEYQSKNKVSLDETSLEKLKAIINETNAIPNEERLLTLYEKEREHYIFLISIITIIITIISIYFIFTRFVEKEEYTELKSTAREMNSNYEKILREIRFNLMVQEVIIKTDLYNKNLSMIDDETMKLVSNISEFEKYSLDQFNDLFNGVMDYSLETNFKKIFAPTINLIAAANKYAVIQKYITEAEGNIPDGKLFKLLIYQIKIYFGKTRYREFKEFMKTVLPGLNLPS